MKAEFAEEVAGGEQRERACFFDGKCRHLQSASGDKLLGIELPANIRVNSTVAVISRKRRDVETHGSSELGLRYFELAHSKDLALLLSSANSLRSEGFRCGPHKVCLNMTLGNVQTMESVKKKMRKS